MTTSLEILDTAIKIGLGALISAIGAYVLTRLNHQKDVEKTQLIRRMHLLEQVAATVYKLIQAAIDFYACSHTRARYFERDNEVPDAQETKWKRADAELNEALSETTNAESVLLLLGEGGCQELLRAFGEYLATFSYNAFRPEHYSAAEVEEFKNRTLEMRKEFLQHLLLLT